MCVRTYRLFFVSGSEDYFWKIREKDEMDQATRSLRLRTARRKKWMDSRVGTSKEEDMVAEVEPIS